MTNRYAGFWVRFLALYLEGHLTLLVFSFWVYSISQSQTLTQLWQGLVAIFVFFVLPYAVISIFLRAYLTYRFGGGIGKLLTGLRVIDSDKKFLSFKRSLFRYTVGYTFSSVLLLLGFLSVIKDPQKRGFHDKIVGSYVVITQTLWPFALILWLIVVSLNFYLLFQTFNRVMAGPLKYEILQLGLDYQLQLKNAEDATKSAVPTPIRSAGQEALATGSALKVSPSPQSGVIFINLKDSVTEDQIQSLSNKLKTYQSVAQIRYLTKDQATQAYKNVAPNSLPIANLGPVLIVILNNTQDNAAILKDAQSKPYVQTALPYSL